MNKILLFLLSAAVALCAQDKIYASFDVAAAKDAQLALKASRKARSKRPRERADGKSPRKKRAG